MARTIVGLAAGIIFGLGLGISEMVNPIKVKAFLDVAGAWDPSLILVMAAAVGVTFVSFRLVLRRPRPILDTAFRLPGRREIDARLVGGSALFGLGWGIVGYCPGPAISSLAYGQTETFVFLAAMVAGLIMPRVFGKADDVSAADAQQA